MYHRQIPLMMHQEGPTLRSCWQSPEFLQQHEDIWPSNNYRQIDESRKRKGQHSKAWRRRFSTKVYKNDIELVENETSGSLYHWIVQEKERNYI